MIVTLFLGGPFSKTNQHLQERRAYFQLIAAVALVPAFCARVQDHNFGNLKRL